MKLELQRTIDEIEQTEQVEQLKVYSKTIASRQTGLKFIKEN